VVVFIVFTPYLARKRAVKLCLRLGIFLQLLPNIPFLFFPKSQAGKAFRDKKKRHTRRQSVQLCN
jgi:hypothetical protein